jgi:hypothetical protein
MFDGDAGERFLDRLREFSSEYGPPSLVIFDPILRMLSGIDEFKATEIAESVFLLAQRIQQEFDSAVVLVHHKSKNTNGSKSSYGSVAFHAFSENSLYLSEPDDEGWVEVTGEYKSERETTWSYRLGDNLEEEYAIKVSLERRKLTEEQIEEKVLGAIEKAPGILKEELVSGLEISSGKAQKALTSLREKGMTHPEKEKGVRNPRNLWYPGPQPEEEQKGE